MKHIFLISVLQIKKYRHPVGILRRFIGVGFVRTGSREENSEAVRIVDPRRLIGRMPAAGMTGVCCLLIQGA